MQWFRSWCCVTSNEDAPTQRFIEVNEVCSTNEYCSNEVTSSKYNPITFLPLNFFNQIQKPINAYFIIVAALQFIPGVAPVSPYSTIFPITIAFGTNAVKEAIDDIKRRRQDARRNSVVVDRVNKRTRRLETVKSRDIGVGDILVLKSGETVPCDVVALSSSDAEGVVYVSTESLDGESGCKERYAVLPTATTEEGDYTETTIHRLFNSHMQLAVELPNYNLNSFSGTADWNESAGKPARGGATAPTRGPLPAHGETDPERKALLSPQREESTLQNRHRVVLNTENAILFSSVVQHTSMVFCVVVYTGMETKVNLARSPPLSKNAAIDETYNKVAIAIFVLQIFLVLLFSVLTNCTDKHSVWYLGLNKKRLPLMETAVVLPLRFFSMLSPMVPLSFKVMVELSKSYISRVISWDESIQHEGEPALVNNSSLAENLGQVEILVTDKTGTLTSNVMRFKALSTSKGQVFEVDSGDMPVVAKLTSTEANTYHLLLGMTFCNMMKRADAAQNGNHSLSHEASDKWISTSPDEMALTDGAGLCGVVLETRTKTAVKCQFIKEPVTMNIAHVLQFTSERGRMSVLLLDETSKEYLLLTKGSDDSVLPLCLDEKLERSVWSNCVRVFSNRGLRTLVFGYRRVSHTEATDFLRGVNDPNADEDQKKCCCDVLESRLIYCGCTAVKDELQDGVPETVDSLRLANIKLWMITGDKMETAMQTGIASRILRNSDSVLNLIPPDTASLTVEDHLYYVAQRLQEHRNNHLVEAPVPPFWRRMIIKSGLLDFAKEFLLKPNPEILKPVSHQLKRLPDRDHRSILSERHTNQLHRLTSIDSYTDSGNVCVIFSGRTLALIEHSGSAPLMENFQKVLCASGSVICSRTSPNQKAKIVDMAKLSKKVTLAIGDGGNDVAMIQKAHVGVGIKGKEGNQASAASDFSLCQFRFLSTLLFVHGHSAFHRTAMIVQQSFWKTVLIAWVQVLFNFHTVYSGVSFWDSFSLMLYNAIPTVPVTFLCVMDIPLSAWMLLNNPRLYRMSQSGRYLTAATFYGYVLRAILHGTVIFYLAAAFHSGGNEVQLEGHTLDRNGDFYAAYFAIVTIHTYTVLTESHAINFAQWTCFAFSVISCFWCFAASAQSTLGNQTFLVLLKNPKFYLEYIALLGLIALSLALYATVKASWFPNLLQYQRAVVLRIHRYCRPSSLLSILFADDNPSAFLRSLSPLHLLLPNPIAMHVEDVSSGDDFIESGPGFINSSSEASSVRVRTVQS